MTAATRRVGFLAAGLAWLFGLGHLAWAGGIAVLGATPEQFEKTGAGQCLSSRDRDRDRVRGPGRGPAGPGLGPAVGFGRAPAAAARCGVGRGRRGGARRGLRHHRCRRAGPGHRRPLPVPGGARGDRARMVVLLVRAVRRRGQHVHRDGLADPAVPHTHPPGPVRKGSGGAGNPPGTPPPPARPSGHPRPTGCGPATWPTWDPSRPWDTGR
jgi:hypothetical protein